MTTAQSHHVINIDEVFDSLKQPLALIEDSQRRDEMQRFIETARVHQERAVFDLISDIVARVNEASGETTRPPRVPGARVPSRRRANTPD